MRTLDLFCGGGGSSWGAQAAGAQIVCGIDGWDMAARAYAKNFPGARTVHRKMTRETRPVEFGDLGTIDLMLASPECTSHTCARGSRPKDESSRATARFVLNFAKWLRPEWVVVENVVHMKGWNGYGPLIEKFNALGYRTSTVVLDAADFGVPQNRRRMFVLCGRDRSPPLEILGSGSRAPTVAEILDSPGTWASRPLYGPGRAAATLQRAETGMAALGRGVPFLIVYYGSDSSGGYQPLDRPLRTITTIDRFGLVTWTDGVPMLRMLQVSELQRAMGFTPTYNIDGVGARRDRVKLLGNGVAPPVMEAVVRQLLRMSRAGRVSPTSVMAEAA